MAHTAEPTGTPASVGRLESFFRGVRFLQRGHAEKCKTWRTTNFPAARHTLGVRCWCAPCASDAAASPSPRWQQAETALRPRCEGVEAFLFRWMPKFGPIKALARTTLFIGRTGPSPFFLSGRVGTKVKNAHHQYFTAGSTPNDCCPRKRHVWGTRQSRWFLTWPAALLSLKQHFCAGQHIANYRNAVRCQCV
jgi:hypothetical protein